VARIFTTTPVAAMFLHTYTFKGLGYAGVAIVIAAATLLTVSNQPNDGCIACLNRRRKELRNTDNQRSTTTIVKAIIIVQHRFKSGLFIHCLSKLASLAAIDKPGGTGALEFIHYQRVARHDIDLDHRLVFLQVIGKIPGSAAATTVFKHVLFQPDRQIYPG